MPWRKGLTLDPATWRKVWVDLVQAAMVAVVPAAHKIPQADAAGKLDAGWIPPLGISQLPVAADGEVSATKVVVADDSRLGNPPVGGDLSGTAASATVAKLRGRTVAAASPANGQALVWNNGASQWEPGTVSGGTGAVPAGGTTGQVLTKASGTDYDASWASSTGGGSTDAEVGSDLYLFSRFT